jgi:hypothetical protein
VLAALDGEDISVAVVAQADAPGVTATEGTDWLNRAGATGILIWGGPAVFNSTISGA